MESPTVREYRPELWRIADILFIVVELYTALQQRMMGQANPPRLVTLQALVEAVNNYSLNEQRAIPDMMIVSTKVWGISRLRKSPAMAAGAAG